MKLGHLGKLSPNTPNHMQRSNYEIESNSEILHSHFTSNGVLINCQGYLRVDLYLFQGNWGLTALWDVFRTWGRWGDPHQPKLCSFLSHLEKFPSQ